MFIDDLLKFKKDFIRMCNWDNCSENCPLYTVTPCNSINFYEDDIKKIKHQVAAVEKWAKEHPVKMTTREKELKKIFPNSEPDLICPKRLYGGDCKDYEKPYSTCYQCKSKFWNKEIEEREDKDD